MISLAKQRLERVEVRDRNHELVASILHEGDPLSSQQAASRKYLVLSLGGLKVGMFPQRCAVYAMVATGRADGSSSVRAGDFVVQGNLTNVIEYIHSIVVGADGAGTNPINMYLAEIALFRRYLFPDEVVAVMNSLRAKWQCV